MKRSINSNSNTATTAQFTPGKRKELLAIASKVEKLEAKLKSGKLSLENYIATQTELIGLYEQYFQSQGGKLLEQAVAERARIDAKYAKK